MNANPKYRADFLLVFRAFAGLFVVVNHVYGVIPWASNDSTLRLGALNFSFILNGAAQTGVYMFFCLSGYLMAKGFHSGRYAVHPDGIARFYWSRFLRIVPLYVFYILVVLTIGGVSSGDPGQMYSTLAQLFTFRYSAGPGDIVTLMGNLWTISTEVQFYLIVPLIAGVLLFVKPSPTQATAAIGWIAAAGFLARAIAWSGTGFGVAPWGQTLTMWSVLIFKPLTQNLDLFLAGMMLNFIPRPAIKNIGVRQVRGYFAAILGLYVLSAAVTHLGVGRMFSPGLIVLWALGLPTITLFASLAMIWYGERLAYSGDIPAWGGWRHAVTAFSFVGTVTYGIYLWHDAFLNHSLQFLIPFEVTSPLSAFSIALVTTLGFSICAAAVTYYGIEVRFERYKRSTWWRKPESETVPRFARSPLGEALLPISAARSAEP